MFLLDPLLTETYMVDFVQYSNNNKTNNKRVI